MKTGPSTLLDQWIVDMLRADPDHGWTSRELAQRTGGQWPLQKISLRMAVLARRRVLVRSKEMLPGRQGYEYRLP